MKFIIYDALTLMVVIRILLKSTGIVNSDFMTVCKFNYIQMPPSYKSSIIQGVPSAEGCCFSKNMRAQEFRYR